MPILQLQPPATQLMRTVQASTTHKAHWFNVTKDALSLRFGSKAIESLISELSNGVSSADNQSMRTLKGCNDIASVRYTGRWEDKPLSLHFEYITIQPNDHEGLK